jgi:hypothetical protein
MTNDFMRDTAITGELNSNILMNQTFLSSQLTDLNGDQFIVHDPSRYVLLELREEQLIAMYNTVQILGNKAISLNASPNEVTPSSHITGYDTTHLMGLSVFDISESQERSQIALQRQITVMQQHIPVFQDFLVSEGVDLEDRAVMLDHSLMTTLNQTTYKLFGGLFSDLILGLIASTTNFLNVLLRSDKFLLYNVETIQEQ